MCELWKNSMGSRKFCRLKPETLKTEGRKRGEVLGRGFDLGSWQLAPSHQQRGLGSAVSSPSGIRGEAPAAERFSSILRSPDGLLVVMYSQFHTGSRNGDDVTKEYLLMTVISM